MLKIVHLLDDFSMGGVVRALGVFGEPELTAFSESRTVAIPQKTRIAPRLDADVIITHFPASWARLTFFKSLKIRNPQAKLVHLEHSYTRNFEHHNVKKTARFRFLIRLAMRSFDDVICVSNGQRQWLTTTVNINAEKCRTIYPWSGRDELLQLPPPDRQNRLTLRLAAYGRYSRVKNFAALIDAVAGMPGKVELILAGTGPEEADLVARASFASNVTLHGPISDIGKFLETADAVIVPSLSESFGLVAAEAKLAARPIITANIDGLPEQVGKAGVAAPCSSPPEIAAAIELFRQQPFDAMSKAARRDAAGLREPIINQWVDLLKR